MDKNHHSGLTGAVYILKCLNDGQSLAKLIQEFGNDEKIISVWINFLKENHLIKENMQAGRLIVSENGKAWIRRYAFAIR